MQLLKQGSFSNDNWQVLADGDMLPATGDVIVSFERLESDHETLRGRNTLIAVSFPNHRAIEELAPYLGSVAKVVLDFPAFSDGRAYSQARQLRREFSYDGEIQAGGNVLPDQLAFMRQCGFDVFHVNGRFSAEQWQKAATSMTLTYQQGYGPERGFSPADVWSRRKVANDDQLRSDFEEVWSA